jgi:dienelactone hydrolase
VEWHFFSDAQHGFRHPDNPGFQPYYADLTWPLTTSFLQRTV